MFEAGKKIGLPYLADVNSSSTSANGCTKAYFTQKPNGLRDSTFTAFLPEPLVRSRQSWLHICTGASATRLDVQNINGSLETRGVFLRDVGDPSKTVHVKAKREVILCSGPFESPKILQLRFVYRPSGPWYR